MWKHSGAAKSHNWVKTGYPLGIYLADWLGNLKSILYCIELKRA
jgi:hypothetical protein